MKIERLTSEQEAMLPVYRDKWIKIGLCTEPANRVEAEKAITSVYKCAGLEPPQKIVWCSSPLSQGLTRTIVTNSDKYLIEDSIRKLIKPTVGASVSDSVGASVWASVWDSVDDSVRDSVWDSVGDSVRDSVRASIGDSVWASVRASVWDSVRDSVRASVWASVWDSVRASGYGQHDANWLGFYEYFRDVLKLENETEKLVGLIKLAKNSGWFLPYEKICWISERHNILNLDARGRLHSLSAPAVGYPDGWSIYAVHGVRVPANVIENRSSITLQRIEKEENTEVRRVMIELYGQQKYLIDSGAKEIHRDDFGVLYKKELPNDEPLVMVKVVNSTPETNGEFKDYFLRVPPDVQTAHDAVAWTFGKNKSSYLPKVET